MVKTAIAKGTTMAEPTDSTTLEYDDDWLAAPTTDAVDNAAGTATVGPATSRRTLAVRAGLVAAGAVVGGIVVTSVHHNSSTAATSPTSFVGPQGGANGQIPGGQFPGGQIPGGQLPGSPQGGFGGLAGEQHVTGTLVSVGSSTVTVRSSSGVATYTVTSATQVVRNGRAVQLSALRAGDPVLVHVYPSGSGSRLTVERLFAGSSATT
jgi:hypothetical protein